VSLLEAAIDAHGGAARWAGLRELRADIRGGGLLWPTKGRRAPDIKPLVSCHEPVNVLEDYTAPGRRGVFDRGDVRIEEADGTILIERPGARSAFRPLSRRAFYWDDLDVLYFVGYASWNYLTAPWLLAFDGVQTRELPGNRLAATFPPHIPTHSAEQVFHFDDEARLIRLDYTAEPIGRLAKAAHLCFDHREFDGLLAPTRRHVVPLGPGARPLPGPKLVKIALVSVSAV
jgi:hypothetical protein